MRLLNPCTIGRKAGHVSSEVVGTVWPDIPVDLLLSFLDTAGAVSLSLTTKSMQHNVRRTLQSFVWQRMATSDVVSTMLHFHALLKLELHNCSAVTSDACCHIQQLLGLQHLVLREFHAVTDDALGLLSHLAGLRHLELTSCQNVTRVTFLEHLRSLEHLNLAECYSITSAGLTCLQHLKRLEHLNLSACDALTTPGLVHLSCLTGLQSLNLGGCYNIHSGCLSYISGTVTLTRLILKNVRITSSNDMSCLRRLTQLQEADFALNNMNNSWLRFLVPLTSLQQLNLQGHDNILRDNNIAHLSRLTALQRLYLGSSFHISDVGLAHLSPLTNLRLLQLRSSRLFGLEHLSQMTLLEHLDLEGCERLTTSDLAHLPMAPSLAVLKLQGCKDCKGVVLPSNGEPSPQLERHTALRQLELGGCILLKGNGFAARLDFLPSLGNLQVLKVVDCLLTEYSLAQVGHASALRELDLRWCDISDEGLAHLTHLSHLSGLSLHSCRDINTAGLRHLTCLPALQRLQLDYKLEDEVMHLDTRNDHRSWNGLPTKCRFTDDSAADIALVTSLQALNIAFNEITGRGLAHIAQLTRLTALDMSDCPELDDEALAHLPRLRGLRSLHIVDSKHITGTGVRHLSALQALELLELSSLPCLACDDLSHLSHLTALQHLTLRRLPNITSDALRHLSRLTRLVELDLSESPGVGEEGLVHLSGLVCLQTVRLDGIYIDWPRAAI